MPVLAPSAISREAMAFLTQYDWPGNIRELENAMERAVVVGWSDRILAEDLPESVLETAKTGCSAPAKYHDAIRNLKKQLDSQRAGPLRRKRYRRRDTPGRSRQLPASPYAQFPVTSNPQETNWSVSNPRPRHWLCRLKRWSAMDTATCVYYYAPITVARSVAHRQAGIGNILPGVYVPLMAGRDWLLCVTAESGHPCIVAGIRG